MDWIQRTWKYRYVGGNLTEFTDPEGNVIQYGTIDNGLQTYRRVGVQALIAGGPDSLESSV